MTNEELAVEIKAGRAGYGELWGRVRDLVRMKAYQYRTLHIGLCEKAGVEEDDLIQCGFMALRDAVEAFPPESGCKLTTYLRYPLLTHFRAACGIRSSKQDPLLQAARLDKPVNGEPDAATLGEMTEDHAAGDELERVEDGIFRQQLHAAMEKALDTLEPTQRDTIRRRYYAGDTLAGIAADYGVTPERVRQVESRGLRALRRPACVKLLRPFIEEMRSCYAWTGTGWASFRHTGTSSVERAAEKTEALMQRIQEQREQERADLCALLSITTEEFDRRFGRPQGGPL